MINKTIVIGIDGATYDFLLPWISRGKFKNIKKLMYKGSHGVLKSIYPPLSGPAWASFQTGKNPGKHGVFEWLKHEDRYAEISVIDSTDIDSVTFYEILNYSGFKCCLINLLLSSPPRISGTLITSFITKDDKYIYPESLEQEIDFKGFKFNIGDIDKIIDTPNKLIEFLESRISVIKKLFKGDFDFFFCLFTASDTIQHGFLDKMSIDSGNRINQKALKVFEKIDEYVGWFDENKNSNDNLIIISDHGFKTYKGIFYVNQWLYQEGFLIKSKESSLKHYWGNNIITELIRKNYYVRKTFQILYRIFSPFLPIRNNIKTRAENHLSDGIDIKKSIAFCPSSDLGYIFINDERFYGIVTRDNYKKVRNEIISSLNNSGLIRKALPKEKVYSGKHLTGAPDIIIIPSKYKISSEILGNKILKKIDINDHSKNGIFISEGPNIKNNFKLKDHSLIDIAPTILYLMKASLPHDMDGIVIGDMFVDNYFKENKVRYLTESEIEKIRDKGKKNIVNKHDEKKVKERLRSLGYL